MISCISRWYERGVVDLYLSIMIKVYNTFCVYRNTCLNRHWVLCFKQLFFLKEIRPSIVAQIHSSTLRNIHTIEK